MSEELFTTKDTPDWMVRPIYLSGKRKDLVIGYALRFNNITHLKRSGEHGRRTLQDMADFMNRRGMQPREKVECLADEGLPPLPRAKQVNANTSPS